MAPSERLNVGLELTRMSRELLAQGRVRGALPPRMSVLTVARHPVLDGQGIDLG